MTDILQMYFWSINIYEYCRAGYNDFILWNDFKMMLLYSIIVSSCLYDKDISISITTSRVCGTNCILTYWSLHLMTGSLQKYSINYLYERFTFFSEQILLKFI